MKIACFSVAAMDYFPKEELHYAGGNALNQSIRFASMGDDAYFVGALGTDHFGDKLESLLIRYGVNISLLDRVAGISANNRIINDASGERFGEDGAWNGGVFENYRMSEGTWQKVQEMEVWSTHSSCPDFMEALKRKGQNKLCVDYLHLPDYSLLESTVNRVDIAYIGGDATMVDVLLDLSKKTSSLIVLTLGKEGSVCLHKGKRYDQKALSSRVIDTTGCGDAFQAGFTHSYYSDGSIKNALSCGARQGKLASEHFGGVKWQY